MDFTCKNEIQEFTIDDIPSEYTLSMGTMISYNVNFSGLETKKIHIKYKSVKNLSFFGEGAI